MTAPPRRRSRLTPGLVWALATAVVLPGGCACARELSHQEIQTLVRRWPAPQEPQRTQATIQMQSVPFTGEFQGVFIQRPAPLAIRMQLFPDLGGKVLDLTATAETQEGILPLTGSTLSYPNGARDRLLGMFAATALEITTPLDPKRIQCCRVTDSPENIWLQLRPRYGTSSCVVELRGTTRHYQLRRDGVGWNATVQADGTLQIEGRGFLLSCAIDEREALESVPDQIFAPPAR